jgi:hypothetical protein
VSASFYSLFAVSSSLFVLRNFFPHKSEGGGALIDATVRDPRRAHRCRHLSALGAWARHTGRARLPALRRGSCCSERTPQLNSSDALPVTVLRRNGRYPLPAVVQCSGLPRGPVIVPDGRGPGVARERNVSFRPREPLPLRFQEHPLEGDPH